MRSSRLLPDISRASLELLLRPPVGRPVVSEDLYQPTSLHQDIQQAFCPEQPLTDELIVNIILKYFYCYVYPGSSAQKIALSQVSLLFDAFVHRRQGSEVLKGREALRRDLLKYGFALAMLADVPKTAHIFREIAGRKILPQQFNHRFQGIDIGAGTGILMLAQAVAARRNSFQDLIITGIERETNTSLRTAAISSELGTGLLVSQNAVKPETYSFIDHKPVTVITNETLPGTSARLWKEDFILISQTLFRH
ncbi:MAG: hypothetical protein ACOCV7_03935, partial [Desulfonatronovibrionaceae bacterium]